MLAYDSSPLAIAIFLMVMLFHAVYFGCNVIGLHARCSQHSEKISHVR